MASTRDYMYNPQWRATYKWGMVDPNSNYYGNWKYDEGGFLPIFTDSNPDYSIRMDRHGSGMAPYNTGIVNPELRSIRNGIALENCADNTGAPVQCARAILRPPEQTYPEYTVMRRL